MKIEQIKLGHWTPQTTIHLAELYDFLSARQTPLHLSPARLVHLRSRLNIQSKEQRLGEMEYIDATTTSGLKLRMFEDGLITLTHHHANLKADIQELQTYYREALKPALQYLFGIGAPTPKALSGLEQVAPVFIVTRQCTRAQAVEMLAECGEVLEFEMDTKDVVLYRGGDYFVINARPHFTGIEELIESWVYFKQFKAQLHHYLNLHRTIWAEVEAIKEERSIRGWSVKAQRSKLEAYKKTIELIEARISQMDLYMSSRNRVASDRGWDQYLSDLLQFRYTNLEHAHDYVKSLWQMTRQYVDSAVQVMAELDAQATRVSVQTLTVISSLGMIAGVFNYLSAPKVPKWGQSGLEYFVLLLMVAIVINVGVQIVYGAIKYRVNEPLVERAPTKPAQRRR